MFDQNNVEILFSSWHRVDSHQRWSIYSWSLPASHHHSRFAMVEKLFKVNKVTTNLFILQDPEPEAKPQFPFGPFGAGFGFGVPGPFLPPRPASPPTLQFQVTSLNLSILCQIRSETIIFNSNIVIRFPPAPVDSPAQCLILWLSTQHSQLWPQLSGNWPIRDQHHLMIDQSQSSRTGGEVVWTWSCHCLRSNQRCLWYSSSWQDAGTLVQPRCSRGNTLQTHDCW